MKIKILIPVYNDWQSTFKLIDEINGLSIDPKFQISIIIVNDASNHDRPNNEKDYENFQSLKIINMKINQGHARCIATGLKYIYQKEEFDYIIPMDGDGEDRPEEIKEFLNKIDESNGRAIIGQRVKRSEGLIFKICYQMHKLITLTFTGKSIRFGNYTCLPKTIVEKMINEKATWNSFSGSLTKLEKDLLPIPSSRGPRYFGPSKMSFYNLIKHSLSIIAVFKINVIVRSVLFCLIYLFLISENLSYITSLPLIAVIMLVISVLGISKRENLEEYKNSLENIQNIENIK